MQKAKKENHIARRGRIIWLYVIYQIVSKALLGIVVLPMFGWLTSQLIALSGRTNLSSGDFVGFFLSIYGIPVIVLGILLLILMMGIDINTFIIISALLEEGKLNFKMKSVLKAAIKSVKLFFSPLGALLVIFIGIVLPLLNIGIKMGPLKDFKIPNFITSVIFNNPLNTALYGGALTALLVISLIYIFSVHFILLDGQSVAEGFKSSRQLVFKHWKSFVVDYLIKLIQILVICIVAAIALLGIVLIIDLLLANLFKATYNENIAIIVLLLSGFQIFSFFASMTIPAAIAVLTKLFYKYNAAAGKTIRLKLVDDASTLSDEQRYAKIRLRTKFKVVTLVILIVTINFSVAWMMETYFTEIFKTEIKMELIAHRGGGDLGAENTIQGIEVAIDEGVDWTEIDVQRTADGHYIINHDKNFSRVAGVAKTPMEMTLAEIKQLKVKNEFQPDMAAQPVPTLPELLDACKGKIGVFVELKGKSADHKMVDDVVAMIEAKGMRDEAVILSLDYSIIEYTHDNYPQIKTGFLYYFSIGDLKNLKGDYLIMEEREATEDNIDIIHEAGKKAVVWTVNTPESIERFIKSDVDGIITDYIPLLKAAISEANQRSHLEIIIDSFIK